MTGGTITVEGVTARFGRAPRTVTALDDVSLTVASDQIHAIIGRSGAGKSTLVRTINGLAPVSSGRVLVDGEDITAASAAQLRATRRRIGMVFQHFNLYDRRTVAANVAFPLELQGLSRAQARSRTDRVLELVGLSDRAGHSPAQLSGGQKQRVGIARALVSEPNILLCDEATSALDSETTEQILALLEDVRRELGLTIVLITHELDVVKRIADDATLLESGRVVESGEVRSLVRDADSRLGAALFPHRVDAEPHNGPGSLTATFEGNLSARPYVSALTRDFDVDVTVASVSSERIAGVWFSRFHLIIARPDGSPAPLQPISAWLTERNVHVDRY
ncbi:MAG: methionine ABC transporter ATP-binding protein [Mycetocola reblochoni]|uniref:methionine ABC transporter ATP-binding protein n=2 Tax=Mycetocola reblochoni TaxID=331618 RepID=UPI0015C584BC|nr:ATP-binding cassette domain-containing protein [Mycetocola reblochoni]